MTHQSYTFRISVGDQDAEESSTAAVEASVLPPVRIGRVALTLRIKPELHRELRAAAFQADTTIQELILLALNSAGYKEASSETR